MRRRGFWIVLGLLILIGIGSSVFSSPGSLPLTGNRAEKKEDRKKEVTIALVGDIMLDRGVKRSVEQNFSGDYSALFQNVPELFEADIAFANLEGPIAAGGRNVGSQYSFRMSPAVLPALKGAGFDVLSFANNHVGDWSREAFLETLTLLNQSQIAYVGAGINKQEAFVPKIISTNGQRIGFLAFSDVGPNWLAAKESTPGIAIAEEKTITEAVQAAAGQVDTLIVSFHWGEEYKPRTLQQKKLAELAIDAGADVIIGHHPHVIQATETYKGKPIFYSLGNFIFDQSFSAETMRGAVVFLTISPEGQISYEQKTTDLNKSYQPQILRPVQENDAVLAVKAPAPKPEPFACSKPKKVSLNYFLISLPNEEVNLSNYIPNDLVQVSTEVTGGKNICVTKDTYAAYKAMLAAMKKDEVEAHVLSGWRDKAMQAENIKEQGSSIAAPVGQSEHHLGTAIDFTSGTVPVKFIESPEFTWLAEHAWEYGFVQSYQPDHSGETGFTGEAWHWRYVGKTHAKKIRKEQVALNKYLAGL